MPELNRGRIKKLVEEEIAKYVRDLLKVRQQAGRPTGNRPGRTPVVRLP